VVNTCWMITESRISRPASTHALSSKSVPLCSLEEDNISALIFGAHLRISFSFSSNPFHGHSQSHSDHRCYHLLKWRQW
jgi:hypothetical protein